MRLCAGVRRRRVCEQPPSKTGEAAPSFLLSLSLSLSLPLSPSLSLSLSRSLSLSLSLSLPLSPSLNIVSSLFLWLQHVNALNLGTTNFGRLDLLGLHHQRQRNYGCLQNDRLLDASRLLQQHGNFDVKLRRIM